MAGLVQATDGNFYGATSKGGIYGYGTIFQITPDGTLTTLHSFDSTDGANPIAVLIQATDGNFYVTTNYGGANSGGAIFQITPSGSLTTLYNFCRETNCSDGATPISGLVQATDGNLYGTTYEGGAHGYGTIFQITLGGALTTTDSFNSTNGANPASVLKPAWQFLYGTTDRGGAYGYGTIFGASWLQSLHSFNGNDGTEPSALILATDGNFYGTTGWGGNSSQCIYYTGLKGCGTVFQVRMPGAAFIPLYTFCSKNETGCPDGSVPSELVQASDGSFYGVTFGGGVYNRGTVFRLSPVAALSRTSLNLGNVALTETSTAIPVNLKNTGMAPLNMAGITIEGSNFAISANTCGNAMLGIGKTCRVSVTFTPTAVGRLTGTLTFNDNAPNHPQTVALSGTGVEPATLTPASTNFASWALGTASTVKIFTLANNQNVALTNVAISATGDFAVPATTCTTALSARSKCTISVTFPPTALGTRTGMLAASYSNGNSPQTAALTGMGIEPTTLTPTSTPFGSWGVGITSAVRTFTLTNNQSVELTGIKISTTGDFEVSATACTTNLAAKSNCTINVAFTPTATGTRAGKLIVSDSAHNSPHTSTLTGTGK